MNEMPSGVKIPDGANPYRAIVNGVEHAYEAGAYTEERNHCKDVRGKR